jgi:crossover junction endodeoxyribonuclease RuvC
MANKIFIGIDPGLIATAWATHEGVSGVITSERRGIARVADIRRQLTDTIAAIPGMVSGCMWPGKDFYAIEGYSFGSPYSAHQLGELGGAIRLYLFGDGRSYVEIPPSTLKKFATGSGRAKKDELRLAVFKRWGKEFKTDHEVDAFILAKIAEAVFGDPGPLTQFQSEVVKRCKQNLAAQTVESDNKSVKP